VILIIVSAGCFLYYRSVQSHIRLQEARTQKYLDRLVSNGNKDVKPVNSDNTQGLSVNRSIVNREEHSVNTDLNMENHKSSYKSNRSMVLPEELILSEPLKISPHGFGAYPDIPQSAPVAEFKITDSVNRELMKRVLVKAWNEGERFTGGTFDNSRGKVYLNYSNIVYVQYSSYVDEETGEIMNHISETMAGFYMDDGFYESIKAGNVPTGYKIVNFDDAGINPYEYLDLY